LSKIGEHLSQLDLDGLEAQPAWRKAEMLRQLNVLALYPAPGKADGGNAFRLVARSGENIVVLDHYPRRSIFRYNPPTERQPASVIWEDVARTLHAHTTDIVKPFVVERLEAGSGARVHVIDATIVLTEENLRQLADGQSLGPEHELTKFFAQVDLATNAGGVLFPDPLTQRDDTPEATDVDAIVATLQAAYPQARILRDASPSPATAERVRRLVEFDRAPVRQTEAVIAPLDVRDYGLMANFEETLKEEGATVFDFQKTRITKAPPVSDAKSAMVLILTGHSNASLKTRIGELGDAGYFTNKVVLFQTCQTPLTRELKTLILEKYGALGISSFVGEIEPAKLGAFLNDVAPWLSGHNVIDGGLRRFLRQNAALHGLKMYDSELEQVVLAPRT
jgi:hypothetical protein